MPQQTSTVTGRTRERRIGRFGRRAHLVTFLHSTEHMAEIRGTDPVGNEYPLLTLGAHESTLRRTRADVNWTDGRRCIEIGEGRPFRPWDPHRVIDAQGRDVATLKTSFWSGCVRTRWNVHAPDGSPLFTITEPLRDGLIHRVLLGPVRSLVGDAADLDDNPTVIVVGAVAAVLCSPVLLFKRRGRLIIRDANGVRVGVMEYRIRHLDPCRDITIDLDADTVARTDPRVLIASTLGPLLAYWR